MTSEDIKQQLIINILETGCPLVALIHTPLGAIFFFFLPEAVPLVNVPSISFTLGDTSAYQRKTEPVFIQDLYNYCNVFCILQCPDIIEPDDCA